MEKWQIIKVTILFSAFTAVGSSKCKIEPKRSCEIKYVLVGDSVEFNCPIPGDSSVSWHFRNAVDTNWTSFPFSFCECHFCPTKRCRTRNEKFEITEVFSESRGYYECRRNGNKHCFVISIYTCERGGNPLPHTPPDIVPVVGKPVEVDCGIDFCDDQSIGSITWLHKGEIITTNVSNTRWTCFSKNVTYMESKLVIEEIKDDDFNHPFVCSISKLDGTVINSFNVSLENDDLVIKVTYLPMSLIILPSTIVFLLVVVVFIYKKSRSVRFGIKTRCSLFGRLVLWIERNYETDVFILHDDDDIDAANTFRSELLGYGFRVKSMEDFDPGYDCTKEIKALIMNCASALVIYPSFHISETLDHQISVVKENIRPYFITLLLHKERTLHSKTDSKLKKLGLKQIIYDEKFNVEIMKWRIPICRLTRKHKMYGATNKVSA